jgi:PAS domain S-box-containing protein
MDAKHGKLRVLNLEDNPNDSELIQAKLESEWAEVEFLRAGTREEFVRALNQFVPDIVLSDFNLPDISGREALLMVRNDHPDIPVVMVTGALGDVEAVELVKLGAKDYVMKDHLQRLVSAVQGAISQEKSIRARKAAEQALRQSESEIRALIEHLPVATVIYAGVGPEEKIIMMNRKFSDLFGYTLEDVPDLKHWWLLAYPDEGYRDQIQNEWTERSAQAVRDHSSIEPMEATVTCKDGSFRYVRGAFSSIGRRNIVTLEDLTGHKQAEVRIERLNQLYEALSQCNQAIVRSNNEQELFARICRSAVQFGSFRMAWIGRIDPATQMVVPVASAGDGSEAYLRDVNISLDADSEYGKGPTGLAIREDHPFWCQDFLGAQATAPWKNQAAKLGWRSSAALPLHCNGKVVGAFMLYADVMNAFDEDVRELLLEMAADIDYSLDYFSHEAQRKQAEDQLRKLSLAVEQSPNSIVITDLDARLEYVNEAFVRATGYSREEAIGKNPRILHSGKNSRASYDDMWAHLTRGEVWRGEFVNRRKDGSGYVESLLISPVRDADGRTTHYLAIKDDITERKRVQQALLESEEKFRVMSASAQDAIIAIDNDGNVTFWNAAAEKTFGYAAQEAMGLNMHQLLTPLRYHESYRKGFANFRQTGEGKVVGKTLELAALHKDGHEFPVELSLSAVNIAGKWQAIGIMRDISARKKIEAQVVAQYEHVAGINTQLVEANRQLEHAKNQVLQSEKMASIGLLAAGVAHEINNPIGYVNSNLGTLEKYLADIFVALDKYESLEAMVDADNSLLEEVRRLKARVDLDFLRMDIKALIGESHQGLERIKKIILDLKDFSRQDIDEQWVWADLRRGLDSTLNVVWNELKYKCEVVKEYGELPDIYCLPSQLDQVFMNLLINAAQAIEVRGTITIRTGQEGDSVWVSVSDTGKGIPPEIIPRLFDPFFTTKPVGKGTGLGLSVSYNIVEKHGGKIEVQSEVGKGTTFRVWLPVQQIEAKEQEA